MKLNKQPLIIDNQAIYDIEDWSLGEYQDLIAIRELPDYKVRERSIYFNPNHLEGYLKNQSNELPLSLSDDLFDYQKVISQVAYLKERYALFLDPGLGKTFVLGELARQIYQVTTGKLLFIVPLNILYQFEEMVQEFFPDFPEFIHLHKNKMSLDEWCAYDNVPRIGFVNHEAFIKSHRLINVNGVFLDESSILKGGQGGNGKIAKHLIANTKGIQYKFAASGTQAPNDRTEYAMVSLYLEKINSENEFYGSFFTLSGDKYILKRNAVHHFYQNLASWSIFMRNPAKYGFEDNLVGLLPWEERYIPIPMTKEQTETIKLWATKGKQQMLDGMPVKPTGIAQSGKFSQVSKGFYYKNLDNGRRDIVYVKSNKPQKIKEIVLSHRPEQILIWTVFDTEGDILEKELSNCGLKVAHITGKTKEDKRIELINQFRHGEIDVMISKPRILGFGLNFQFCRIAIFSGLDNSYEKYFQAVKRFHRYGQEKQVLIYHIYTEYEYSVLDNVMKKKDTVDKDFEYQENLYRSSLYDELKQFLNMENYKPMEQQSITYKPVIEDLYELYHGDSLEIMTRISEGETFGKLRKNSIDFSVFSPPFMGDLFTYSSSPADMGNTRGAGAEGGLDEFMLQFQFFLKGMLTVTKPGRLMAMHLEDIPLRKGLDGHIGLFDFVGEANREAKAAGWILVAKIPILKNQQAQSIIKKIGSLSMSNMEKDRLRIAPCSNGTLCLYRKPGDAKMMVSDLAKCDNCGWEGYAQKLNNWQPDRGYKSRWIREPQTMLSIVDGEEKHFNMEDYTNQLYDYIEKKTTDYREELAQEIDIDPSLIPIPKEIREELESHISPLWMTCPKCESNNILRFSEMNGNKWIMFAEGAWPGDGFENYNSLSKVPQDKRWNDWVQTSLGLWWDIRETDTLNIPFTKEQEGADKHLCPLPKEVARRAIQMYSLPSEVVFTPFSGIGTEMDAAIRLGRKTIGIELKSEYFLQGKKNTNKAIEESTQGALFDLSKFTIK